MRTTRIALLVAVMFAACALNGRAAQDGRPTYVIVAFGDSLTEAAQVAQGAQWPSLLQDMLRRRHPDLDVAVINAGVGGNTSREGLARMEKDVLTRRPNLVIAAFGANDETLQSERHVSVDEYAKNLRAMYDAIVRRTGAKMICWPATPFINDRHLWGKNPFFAAAGGPDQYQMAYRKRMARVGQELQMPFVDMDAIFRRQFKEKGADFYVLPDGIHYREAGNQLVAESLLPEVEKIIHDKVP
jgi:lysophospholipase L1-like esterase